MRLLNVTNSVGAEYIDLDEIISVADMKGENTCIIYFKGHVQSSIRVRLNMSADEFVGKYLSTHVVPII